MFTNMVEPEKPEYPKTVVYVNIKNGNLFSRAMSRFNETSFKEVDHE